MKKKKAKKESSNNKEMIERVREKEDRGAGEASKR